MKMQALQADLEPNINLDIANQIQNDGHTRLQLHLETFLSQNLLLIALVCNQQK